MVEQIDLIAPVEITSIIQSTLVEFHPEKILNINSNLNTLQ
jgi:hypothetical protein